MLKLLEDLSDNMELLHRLAGDELVLAPSQQPEGSIFPGGEYQCSEGESCAVQKLYIEGPSSHELTRMDLEHFPSYMAHLYRCILNDICGRIGGSMMITGSILDELDA
jgi:hypothetical protein